MEPRLKTISEVSEHKLTANSEPPGLTLGGIYPCYCTSQLTSYISLHPICEELDYIFALVIHLILFQVTIVCKHLMLQSMIFSLLWSLLWALNESDLIHLTIAQKSI